MYENHLITIFRHVLLISGKVTFFFTCICTGNRLFSSFFQFHYNLRISPELIMQCDFFQIEKSLRTSSIIVCTTTCVDYHSIRQYQAVRRLARTGQTTTTTILFYTLCLSYEITNGSISKTQLSQTEY